MAVTRFLHPEVDVAIHSDTDTENTAQTIEENPLSIHSLDVDNLANATPVYVKLYNTLETVIVGTTVPDYVFMIPGTTRLVIECPHGIDFSNAAQVATVTAGGTGGTTSPTSAVILRATYNPMEA